MHPDAPLGLPRGALALLLALLLGLTVAACGGDDDDEATTDGPTTTEQVAEPEDGEEAVGGGDVCDAAQRIVDLDDETQGVVNEALGEVIAAASAGDAEAAEEALQDMLDAVRPFIDERLPDLMDAYDDLEASVPDDLQADVATISEFTEAFVTDIADVESVEALQELITAQQAEVNEVSEAVMRVDTFTQEECDIVFAD